MDDLIFFFNHPTNSVHEMFVAESLTLKQWDEMLAQGWRHNGKMMFRNSQDFDENDNLCKVIPLRYRLKNLEFTKSQRKIFNKNKDLRHEIHPLSIDDDKHALFFKHSARFKHNRPLSIWDFISHEMGRPFKTWELRVFKDDKLIACSFIDITTNSLSSTYAMFDLDESKRSLGIYTMLLELLYAQAKKKRFYYPGYAYETPSFYDYKKKFNNTEFYDWETRLWFPL
jgi:leucyl-tRNA---protein transferase